MNCQSAKDMMSEHLDGLLDASAESAFRTHLESCPTCQAELAEFKRVLAAIEATPAEEPSPELERNFRAMLRNEIRAERAQREKSLGKRLAQAWSSLFASPLLQLGYSCCLLLVGVLVGWRVLAPAPVDDSATRREIADLKGKIDSMGQLVAYSIEKQDSDVARLRTVSATQSSQDINNQQLNRLVSALAFDPSTNVRLAAVEALYTHADKPLVRDSVLSSLPRERSLLVQLAMIDFLGSIHDPKAIAGLEAFSRDASTDARAREAAKRALTTQL